MECTSEQIEQLHAIIRSGTSEQRTVERARIVLACIGEQRADQVAQELGLNVSTVYKWRERFRQYGMDGLKDSHRSGRPVIYGKETGDKILAKLEETPPDGLARWDGVTLGKALGIPADTQSGALSGKTISSLTVSVLGVSVMIPILSEKLLTLWACI